MRAKNAGWKPALHTRSHPRNRQALHDLDGVAGEDRKVRVVLEQFGGGFVRLRLHDRVGGHGVPDVAYAACANALRLSKRGAVFDDGVSFVGWG